MESYNDERQSTETCFKLECGHAFHTRCVIQVLTRTNHKCPACNKHKTPEQEIKRAEYIRNAVSKIKRTEGVRIAKTEYATATKDYADSVRQLRKDVREWAKNRAIELNVYEYRTYWCSSKTAVRNAAKTAANTMGFDYKAALNSRDTERYGWRNTKVADNVLFGKQSRVNDYRLMHPTVWCRI